MICIIWLLKMYCILYIVSINFFVFQIISYSKLIIIIYLLLTLSLLLSLAAKVFIFLIKIFRLVFNFQMNNWFMLNPFINLFLN